MEERRRAIMRELNDKGIVRVTDLSEKLKCSKVTLRKDIQAMDEMGLLIRTHGGAVAIEKEETEHKYAAENIYRYTERKKKIAAYAYDLIEDMDTIIIDDASSSFYLAMHIKEHPEKRVAVVTNSLPAGNELSGLSHVELYMIGGHVEGRLPATMGDAAIENMKHFHVDKSFIGVHGINFEVGLTSLATPQMRVKKAILEASEKTYVLADSSKFGGGYLSVICPINKVSRIITDDDISKENIHKAQKLGISMIIAH